MTKKEFIASYNIAATEKEIKVIKELILFDKLTLDNFISEMITDVEIAKISFISVRSLNRYSKATDARGMFLYKALKNEAIKEVVNNMELLSSENA